MSHELPKNLIELTYLIAAPLITSLTTLGIVFLIANQVDTELYAVGGAGLASFIGQELRKRVGG